MKLFLRLTLTLLASLEIGWANPTNALEEIPLPSLTYHLATNAAGYAAGCVGSYPDFLVIKAPNAPFAERLNRATWSTACWLRNVHGLSATPIGCSNNASGQGLPTLVSPRHYLCATHMHPEQFLTAFLDTNNVVHWRKTLQRVDVGGDTSVGILDRELPASVEFLPVLPADYGNYFPANPTNFIQGIGMNQDMCLFSQPMKLGAGWGFVTWDSAAMVPEGPPKNWNIAVRGGDSSNPEMLLIDNQLVLVSHNYTARGGPSYVYQIPGINQAMHLLSTNQHVATDYQLTQFSLTNWAKVR